MNSPTTPPVAPGLTPPPPAPADRATKRRLPVWAWALIGVVALGIGVLLSPIFAVVFFVVLVTGIVALVKGTPTWLRFRSRKVATWVTAVSAIGFLMTGSLANVVLSGVANDDIVAVAEHSPTPDPSPTVSASPTPTPTPTPTSTPTPTAETVTVLGITDGDTIETNVGPVRLIGIDTPEQGAWGYSEAGAELGAFLSTGVVTLVAVDGRDDTDRYNRLLRYVQVNGDDAGLHMIETGWAIARYDSSDGYGKHPLESDYLRADVQHEMPAEPEPEPEPEPVKPSKPAAPATDPQFRTCGDANDAGYGDYQQGVDPEYAWYRDRDGDGWVCER